MRVVIADDHPLYRDGVVRALSASGRVEVVAEAEDGRAALEEIRKHEPDVALVDYRLPDLDGVEVTHAVIRDELPTRVLLVSAFTDSGLVYNALQVGAAGYIAKDARREQIVNAVLGQLLQVVTRDMTTQDNALFIKFNSEVANTTTGSRLDLVFKFGLRQR